MSRGKKIFHELCDAPDLVAAVAALPLAEWQELYGFLLRNYDENGVTGEVFGVALVISGERLAKMKP